MGTRGKKLHSVETSKDYQQNTQYVESQVRKNGIELWYSNCNLQNPGLPWLTFMGSASKFPLK
jgi:hypothetical protein